MRKYCSFFADILSPPKNDVRPINIPPPEVAEEPEEADASDDENEMLKERLELLKKLHQDLDE